jgi:plastocyanin
MTLRRTKLRGASALALTLSAIALSACGVGPAAAADHIVEIRGLEFSPAFIDASPGDTITWINKDVMPHTATSDDGAWDSGNIAAGAEYTLSVKSDFAGGYTCTYHPTMTGEISVE